MSGGARRSGRKEGARRSICPVSCTLDLIGDRWTLLVVRDLLAGKSHFQEFLRSPEGIATNILTARLERLQADGLVEAQPSELRAGTFRYVLTARGRTLRPVLRAMERWGLDNVSGTESRIKPVGDG